MSQISPTKSNLIQGKKSLLLAKTGYDLLDRKRNILVKETMLLMDSAKEIKSKIENIYTEAYAALQNANTTLGICDEISQTVPIDTGVEINFRSVMGVEIPIIKFDEKPPKNSYGFYNTNTFLDDAFLKFQKVKILTVKLAEIENSIYRLAIAIKKTQKRANALKNIVIPRFEENIYYITESLEEKEREEFSRMKVIKDLK